MPHKHGIAVLGAGPIGLEAALALRTRGEDVHVYERSVVGGNLLRWGHVRLFSSFGLNHSTLAAETLAAEGAKLPRDEEYLTGGEHVARYLRPLANTKFLSGRVHEHVEIVSIGRDRIGKNQLIGGPRGEHPFRILAQDANGDERAITADAVVDCTGTYGAATANWMGNGGVPARGERKLRESGRIHYELVDVTGASRERFERKRILLVGSGHSASTALRDLLTLEGTTVEWVARNREPDAPIENDPLPERGRLANLACELAHGADPRVRFHPETTIESIRENVHGSALEIEVRSGAKLEVLRVDEVLAHVGYQPDNNLYRELQVHECYASTAPMKLAAALLADADSGSGADCLTQSSKGRETLLNPEPGFFILGAKSYGRNSNFLIRVGLEQVSDLLALLAPAVAAT